MGISTNCLMIDLVEAYTFGHCWSDHHAWQSPFTRRYWSRGLCSARFARPSHPPRVDRQSHGQSDTKIGNSKLCFFTSIISEKNHGSNKLMETAVGFKPIRPWLTTSLADDAGIKSWWKWASFPKPPSAVKSNAPSRCHWFMSLSPEQLWSWVPNGCFCASWAASPTAAPWCSGNAGLAGWWLFGSSWASGSCLVHFRRATSEQIQQWKPLDPSDSMHLGNLSQSAPKLPY